ncbi:hypothetical protein AVEN_270163-1, partial [Araneus ventricosus]
MSSSSSDRNSKLRDLSQNSPRAASNVSSKPWFSCISFLSTEFLKPYHNQDIVLHLPEGIKITDLRWLSVWSRKFSISFGTVIFPPLLITPQPAVIGPLNSPRRGTSSGTILILDSQTFLISDFNYDGSGT